MLPIEQRLKYWRSLVRQKSVPPAYLPGHADELRVALRDALQELESLQSLSNHSAETEIEYFPQVP